MTDGSGAVADWPILNALLNAAVPVHNGSGVGIGYPTQAGLVVPADGGTQDQAVSCHGSGNGGRTSRGCTVSACRCSTPGVSLDIDKADACLAGLVNRNVPVGCHVSRGLLEPLVSAALAASNGPFDALGPAREALDGIALTPNAEVINAGGRVMVPRFIDPSPTCSQAAGRRYVRIMQPGGSLCRMVSDALFAHGRRMFAMMMRQGSTTVEGTGGPPDARSLRLTASTGASPEDGLAVWGS